MTTITIIDGERTTVTETGDETTMSIAPSDLHAATGWELKPEGLCRDDVCVPVRDRDALLDGAGRIDLVAFAAALHRPVVADSDARVVAIGTSSTTITEQLRTGQAPDFSLPDLDGTLHTLSGIGRKKKVLVVWASW